MPNTFQDIVKKASGVNDNGTAYANTTTVKYSDMSARYPTYYIGQNNEDIYGQNQSTASKWASGFTKGVGLAATTFVNGTVGLAYGAIASIADRDFTSFYDNSFMKATDDFTKKMEDALPNYYTTKESEASWYSPDTWGTANFWSDTILKNTGFAVGAYYSGGAWTKSLSMLSGAVKGIVASARPAISTALELGTLADEATLLATNTARTTSGIASATAETASLGAKNAWGSWAENAVHSTFSAAGESQIEAYHAKTDYKEKLIQTFKAKTGLDPTETQLKEIDETASSIGDMSFGLNMGLLMYRNFVQFPLFNKVASAEAKVLANAERKGIMNIVDKEGNILKRNVGDAVSPNYALGEKLVASRATTAVGNQMERFAVGRAMNRIQPFARLVFSPGEAFEEGTQSLIPNFAEDYYDKGSKTKNDIIGSIKSSFSKTVEQKDFWVSLMSGGLTGGLMENSGVMGGRFGETIRSSRDSRAQANLIVDEINNSSIGNSVSAIAQSGARAEILADEAKELLASGDRLGYENVNTDQRLNYVLSRVQYGGSEMVKQDIDNWRKMASTEDGWDLLQKNKTVEDGVDRLDFLKGLDKLQSTFNSASTIFEALNLRYGTSFDGEGKPTHGKGTIGKMAYVGAKIEDFNSRLQTISNELGASSILTTPLFDFLNDEKGEVKSVMLPNMTSLDVGARTPMEIERVVEAFLNASRETLESNPTLNTDQVDDQMQKLSDSVELSGLRKLAVEEYRRIKDNPSLYEDVYTSESEIDIEEEDNIEVPVKETFKSDFFKTNVAEPVELNFGERGAEVGALRYDPKTDILAVERSDGSLYEVTNQDFRDGVVRFVDPSVVMNDEFLTAEDNRVEIKRAETVANISVNLDSQRTRLQQMRDKADTLKAKLLGISERLKNAPNTTTNEYVSILEKLATQERKVMESSVVKKSWQDYMNGEKTLEQHDSFVKKELLEKGVTALQENLDTLDASMETYEKVGTTMNELQDIYDETEKELHQVDFDIADVESQIEVYNELLINPSSDQNYVLNDIEKQLGDLDNLKRELGVQRTGLMKLLDSVLGTIRSYAKTIRDKAKLSNSPDANLIVRATTSLIENAETTLPQNIGDVFKTVKSKIHLHVSQRDNLLDQFVEIDKQITDLRIRRDALQKVYDQLLDNASVISNPLNPAHFTSEMSTLQPVTPTASVTTVDGVVKLFNGMKKTLRRLFKSTVVLPDDITKPEWYKRYDTLVQNLNGLSRDERSRFRVKIITAKNENQAGLSGLIEHISPGYFKNESDKLDPSNGSILTVIGRENDKGEFEYVDENLNVITNPSRENVVVTRLPNESITYRANGEINHAVPESVSVSAEVLSRNYLRLRTEILSDEGVDRIHSFVLSRGHQPTNNKENDIVGTLIPSDNLSDVQYLRCVSGGQQYTTLDGVTIDVKEPIVFLETEGYSTPVYVARVNRTLASGIVKALEHIRINSEFKGGVDQRFLSFVDKMIPEGVKFDKDSMTISYKNKVIDVADIDQREDLFVALENSKVRVDNDMMTPFSEVLEDGSVKEWATYQEFLLSIADGKKASVYTNATKGRMGNKYLILNNFFEEFGTIFEGNNVVAEQVVEEVGDESFVDSTQDGDLVEPVLDSVANNVGVTVTFEGVDYTIVQEGVRFVLENENKILELDATENTLLSDLDLVIAENQSKVVVEEEESVDEEGVEDTSKYRTKYVDENTVNINDVQYTVTVSESGNVVGLTPDNNSEQVLTNEQMLIEADIARNMNNFDTLDQAVEPEVYAEVVNNNAQLLRVENILTENYSEDVEQSLDKLYSRRKLTDGEKLKVSLWLEDAKQRLLEAYMNEENEVFTNASDNLDIIQKLLDKQKEAKPNGKKESKKTGTNESTKERTQHIAPTKTVDALQIEIDSSTYADKETLKSFAKGLLNNPSLMEDLLEANKIITKYDC